jgi:flagellar protein FliS
MYANANDAYLESRVFSADPVELIRILYESAIAAVEDARRNLAAKAIAERSRSINKACGILAELIASLDRERGGEIADRLAQLYGYMHSRLIEANRLQADVPLADVLSLLKTLSGAWDGAKTAAPREARKGDEGKAADAGAWQPAVDDHGAAGYGAWSYSAESPSEPEAWDGPIPAGPAPAYGTHAWSF